MGVWHRTHVVGLAGLSCLFVGCASPRSVDLVETSAAGAEGDEDNEPPDMAVDEEGSESSESEGGGDEGGGCSFANCDDTPSIESCDPHQQDCPPGEKCTAVAFGGHTWDHNTCVPIADDPVGVGASCHLLEGKYDGLDNCELGAICWETDAQGDGTCYAFCSGHSFECPPGYWCNATGAGVLDLCQPVCDPLLQDCLEGEACVPTYAGFGCALDGSGGDGESGTACEFLNACNPGLFCADQDLVPECGGNHCCTQFCDIDAQPCPGEDLGVSCIPYFEEGEGVDGFEHVGFCGVDE